jgi:hypothetical protein
MKKQCNGGGTYKQRYFSQLPFAYACVMLYVNCALATAERERAAAMCVKRMKMIDGRRVDVGTDIDPHWRREKERQQTPSYKYPFPSLPLVNKLRRLIP